MLANHKFGAGLPAFSSCADRFCLSGYGGGGSTMEEMLDIALKVGGIDGIELIGNIHVNDNNIYDIEKLFKERDLTTCMIIPDLWTQAKWGRGSFAAPDAKTRKAAVEEVKKVMDWAGELNCPYVNIWPGQDGFDYPLQADYEKAWKWLREGLEECCEHNDKTRLVVEYKIKEPRTYCFVGSAAKVLLLLQELDKVGVLLDVGHSFDAGENVSEAAALLNSYGKLDYLHLNDNYKAWDDDMMVSSIHLVEYLEFIYWLKRLDYKGWLTLDIFPYREDKLNAAVQSREWIEALYRAVDRIDMDEFDRVITSADACAATDLVRRAINI